MSNKSFNIILGALSLAVLSVMVLASYEKPEPQIHTNSRGVAHELVTYKSPTCGCCGNWVAYMRNNGYKVEVIETDDVEAIKVKYDVPSSLYSCHTNIVNGGEYFIEGHIPEESITKLFEETPQIKGIGMPGMPSSSPGMPGAKLAPFEIMQVDNLQKISLFEEI